LAVLVCVAPIPYEAMVKQP